MVPNKLGGYNKQGGGGQICVKYNKWGGGGWNIRGGWSMGAFPLSLTEQTPFL